MSKELCDLVQPAQSQTPDCNPAEDTILQNAAENNLVDFRLSRSGRIDHRAAINLTDWRRLVGRNKPVQQEQPPVQLQLDFGTDSPDDTENRSLATVLLVSDAPKTASPQQEVLLKRGQANHHESEEY